MCEVSYSEEFYSNSEGSSHHQQQTFTDLELLDILLGSKNDRFNDDDDLSNGEKCSNFVRNRTVSSGSVDAGLEHWEPGEVHDNSSDFWNSTYIRRTVSEPGTPNKFLQDPFYSGNLSHGKRCKIVGGKKRGPRPKKLTSEEKRQKRREANNRERVRMGQLNTAFDNLRHLLPKHGNDRELSKFETIQIAKNYIKALNEMIRQTDAGTSHMFYQYQQQQKQ